MKEWKDVDAGDRRGTRPIRGTHSLRQRRATVDGLANEKRGGCRGTCEMKKEDEKES